jgi:hypothetical protein
MASRRRMPEAPRAPERFSIVACRERWLEFLELEHEILAPAVDFERDGDDVLVRREPVPGLRIADGRIPRTDAAALLLQAAACGAFLAARGFPLTPRDLEDAIWDVVSGTARLWLAKTPESVAAASASPSPVCQTLLWLLDRLLARGGRLGPGPARDLAQQLGSADAPSRRPEFWVVAVFRTFPELAGPAAAAARQRCLGVAGPALRAVDARAAAEKARAILRGGQPRLFGSEGSSVSPGSALRRGEAPRGAAQASRRLRAEAAEGDPRFRAIWIAVAPEGWDALSRAAFDAAALGLGEQVEVVNVPGAAARPEGPDGWRRSLWVPCGTLAASVRFYEWVCGLEVESGPAARERAAEFLASSGFARFVTDPTGDAPLPLAARPAAAPAADARPPNPRDSDPGRRVELALACGQRDAALDEARRWIESVTAARPEAWFSLSALLAAHLGGRFVAWVESLEAEREIAGGRPADARARLEGIVRHSCARPRSR